MQARLSWKDKDVTQEHRASSKQQMPAWYVCACVRDTEWLSEEMGDGMDWGEEDFVPLYTDCITSRPLYQGPT